MKLTELFDKPNNQYDQHDQPRSTDTEDSVKYKFTVSDSSVVTVNFYNTPEYTDDNCWAVSFERNEKGMPDYKASHDKTGGGGEVEVFSSVVNIIHKFVSDRDPSMILFTSEKVFDDPRRLSRTNLYKRMVQRLASNAYDVQIENEPDAVYFTLVKKGMKIRPKNRLSDYDYD